MVVYKAAMLLGVEVFLSDSVPILLRILQAASVPSCMFACFSSCVYRNFRQPPGTRDCVLMSEVHLFSIYEVAFNVGTVPCSTTTLEHLHFLQLSALFTQQLFFLLNCSAKPGMLHSKITHSNDCCS